MRQRKMTTKAVQVANINDHQGMTVTQAVLTKDIKPLPGTMVTQAVRTEDTRLPHAMMVDRAVLTVHLRHHQAEAAGVQHLHVRQVRVQARAVPEDQAQDRNGVI